MGIQIKQLKPRVLKKLKDHQHLRDNDSKLMANIWYDDIVRLKKDPKELSAYGLLTFISDGKLSNPESIRRNRCKLQQIYKELRGNTYSERKRKQEAIKHELKTYNYLYNKDA